MDDKWQYVPDKECFYCFADLEDLNIKNKVVTGCPKCHRSFVD